MLSETDGALTLSARSGWWQGKALPVVGRIGTQYTLVDASGTQLKPGDMVTAEVDMLFPNPHRRYI